MSIRAVGRNCRSSSAGRACLGEDNEMTKGKCDFYGCENPLAPDQPQTGMKFCIEHDAQFERVAKREPFDSGALLEFWLDAHGGVESMIGGGT